MDKTKQRLVTQKRECMGEGHSIVYMVSACTLFVLKSWPFKKIYKTDCKCFPTSWDLTVEFPEVREDATASLSVALKRIDSAENTDMLAEVFVEICDPYMSSIFPHQYFEKINMQPGDVLQETVEMSSHPETREGIDERVVVHISVTVSTCHTEDTK